MIRVAGAVLILAATFGFSESRIRRERLHLNHLQTLMTFLRLLSDEIRYERFPIPELLGILAMRNPGWIRDIAEGMREHLKGRDGATAGDAFCSVMESRKKEMMLTEEEMGILNDAAGGLGWLDIEAQTVRLQNGIRRLQIRYDEEREQLRAREKVIRYAGAAAGLIVILVLV